MRIVFGGLLAAMVCAASLAAAEPARTVSPTEAPLTLKRAVELALENDPALVAAGHDVRAADARITQAGLRPNPEADLTVENAPGTGEQRGFRQAEVTLQLSQLFELGGKREARVASAIGGRRIVEADREAARLGTMVRATGAFIGVMGAESRLAVAQERADVAGKLLPALRRRVEAGASPTSDLARGEVAASLAKIDLERARTEVRTAKAALANVIGLPNDPSLRVAGSLAPPSGNLPTMDALATLLEGNPLLTRWDAVRSGREAELREQRSLAMPDLTVGVGGRRFAETNSQALVLSARMPLPVYNRNQGAIEAARENLAKVESERRTALRDALGQLTTAYGTLEAARGEIAAIEGSVMPTARRTYAEVQAGYDQGRFRVLELLDAQGTLTEAQARRIEALATYHTAIAEIEGLINRPFPMNGAQQNQ